MSETRAPDGVWGWVVVTASAVCQMLTVGLLWALSILYVSWLDEFDQGKGMTSWVISLGFSLLFGAGPISASLATSLGYRAVVIVGGLMTSVGIILSFWATSVEYLIVAIGMFSGLGCGLAYVPAVAIVPVYFNRKRSLASGMSLSGVSIGSFILAPLLEVLEKSYDWRGTILVLGALTLNIVLCGAVMRPLYSNTAAVDAKVVQEDKCDDHIKPSHKEQNNVNEFTTTEYQTLCDINNSLGTADSMQTKRKDVLSKGAMHTTSQKDDCEDIELSVRLRNKVDEYSPFILSSEKEIHGRCNEVQLLETVPFCATQSYPTDYQQEQNVSTADVQVVLIKDSCNNTFDDFWGKKIPTQKPMVKVDLLRIATSKVSGSMHNLQTSGEHYQLNLHEPLARSVIDLPIGHAPLGNNDISYWGSIQCFKNLLLASTPTLSRADIRDDTQRHMNQTAKISECDFAMTKLSKLSSSKKNVLSIFKENIHEAIRTNTELMKDLTFMILALSHMLLCVAGFTVSVYMVDRIVFQRIEKSIGAIIVSVTSAFNFLGRIFFGFAADHISKDHMVLYIGAVGVSGLSTLLSPLCGSNVFLHGLYAAVVGFTTGGSSTLAFVVNVDLMGVDRVASSYGLLLTFMGLGNLVGMPMAGWLFDWTGTYTIPYIVQGLSFVIADVMLIGLYLHKYKNRRKPTGSEVIVLGLNQKL